MERRIFSNRQEAGCLLAQQLQLYGVSSDTVVISLPRGGVPIGFAVAKTLHVPLDILVVRKLGVPRLPQIAMGAIAEGNVRVLNDEVILPLAITRATIDAVERVEAQELARRVQIYRGDRPTLDVKAKTVLLVDDGIATGMTMRAALASVRQRHPARIVIAVPVAPRDIWPELLKEVEGGTCLFQPQPFLAVKAWYEDFSPPDDAEIRSLLAEADQEAGSGAQESPA